MASLIKQKLLLYKRFKVDIWGIVKSNLIIKKCQVFDYNLEYFSKRGSFKRLNFFKRAYPYIYWKIMNTKTKIIEEESNASDIYIENLSFFFLIEPSKRVHRTCLYFFNKFLQKLDRRSQRTPYYIYDLTTKYRVHKEYYLKELFASIRLVKYFYIIYKYRHFKRMYWKAKKKSGFCESNYLYYLECKLPSFLYRSSLMSDLFETIFFVKSGNLWINKIFYSLIYYSVKPMDLVGFRILHKGYIYWSFYKRLIRGAMCFCIPKYMYISLSFFLILLLRLPRKKDIINPFGFDIYRAVGFIE